MSGGGFSGDGEGGGGGGGLGGGGGVAGGGGGGGAATQACAVLSQDMRPMFVPKKKTELMLGYALSAQECATQQMAMPGQDMRAWQRTHLAGARTSMHCPAGASLLQGCCLRGGPQESRR